MYDTLVPTYATFVSSNERVVMENEGVIHEAPYRLLVGCGICG